MSKYSCRSAPPGVCVRYRQTVYSPLHETILNVAAITAEVAGQWSV